MKRLVLLTLVASVTACGSDPSNPTNEEAAAAQRDYCLQQNAKSKPDEQHMYCGWPTPGANTLDLERWYESARLTDPSIRDNVPAELRKRGICIGQDPTTNVKSPAFGKCNANGKPIFQTVDPKNDPNAAM